MHSARVAALPGEGEDRNGEPAVLLHSPGFYAPFALPTLTHWDAATQSVHLYFPGSFLTEGEDRNGRVFLPLIDVNYSCRSATTILAGRGHGSKAFRGDRAEVLRGGDHGRSRRHHRSSLRGVVVVGVVVVGVVVVGPWG